MIYQAQCCVHFTIFVWGTNPLFLMSYYPKMHSWNLLDMYLWSSKVYIVFLSETICWTNTLKLYLFEVKFEHKIYWLFGYIFYHWWKGNNKLLLKNSLMSSFVYLIPHHIPHTTAKEKLFQKIRLYASVIW